MATKLVILESGNKVKKVLAYLQKVDSKNKYIVKASVGHFRELENSGEYNMGIELDSMTPKFIISPDKTDVVEKLIKAAEDVDEIILATDPDREGEAIAWHLYELLKKFKKPFTRMKLNSITETSVKKELNNLGEIDFDYVNAALSRQMIDRMYGFRTSQSVQQNTGGKSAGRVQSSSLEIIVNRQRESEAFAKKDFWVVQALINGLIFKNVINEKNPDTILDQESFEESGKDEAEQVLGNLKLNKVYELNKAKEILSSLGEKYLVSEITKKDFVDKSFIPFSTDTMLRAAKSIAKMNTKVATNTAQHLFEKGWITYIRTDSNNLDEETNTTLETYIKTKFGANKFQAVEVTKTSDEDQEGHPAITPTHFEWDKEHAKGHIGNADDQLTEEEYKLYCVIWQNTVNAGYIRPFGTKDIVQITNNNNIFEASYKQYDEIGYFEIDKTISIDDQKKLEQDFVEDFNFISTKSEAKKGVENGKPLLNQNTLIAEMKKLGIGRPSTYSSAVEINVKRGYVELLKNKAESFNVKEIGFSVSDYLRKELSDVMNLQFTKQMEKDLDLIAKGKIKDFKQYLKDFYNKLDSTIAKVNANLEKCPKCNKGNWLTLTSKKGTKYFKCSDFTNCDHFAFPKSKVSIPSDAEDCKKCNEGKMIVKKEGTSIDKKTNKKKKWKLIGCSKYPKCDNSRFE